MSQKSLGLGTTVGISLMAGIGLAAITMVTHTQPAQACGGFFCNGGGGGGPTPVVQAAERVIFEQRADGKVRAYVQIRYDQVGGPPIGFSWIIPVTGVPEVGIAEAATFDQLDAATAPQFRFINNASPVASGGSGGCGSSTGDFASASGARSFGAEGVMDVDGVTVWGTSRVGNYETATISGERTEDLLEWLELNGYDIPEAASEIIGEYVEEGHLFVAFKYDPIGPGTGTLDPVVLTYEGDKPCVPIRITSIASTPILDIMVMAFGNRRSATEGGFATTEPDYDAIRPDFTMGTNTTYAVEVLRSIEDAGGRAFVTEYAAPTEEVSGVSDREAQALLDRNAFVTRFYTRLTPEAMTVDPEFIFPGGDAVARLHVIDITPRTASASASTGALRFAMAPFALGSATLAFLWRRRRRQQAAV